MEPTGVYEESPDMDPSNEELDGEDQMDKDDSSDDIYDEGTLDDSENSNNDSDDGDDGDDDDDDDDGDDAESNASQYDEQMERYFAKYRGSTYKEHGTNSVFRTVHRAAHQIVEWSSRNFFKDRTPPSNDTLSRLMGRNRGHGLFLATRAERGFSRGWTGVKILGTGGQGIVGLWEWRGQGPSPLPPYNQIVVKKVIGDLTLNRECYTMLRLSNRGSHTVRLLYPTSKDQCIRQRYDPARREWRGQKRLILEYCDRGDLQTFIKRQRENNQRLPEDHLWRIFLCLVKALSIMDHGTENLEKEEGSDFNGICHFDLKPLNVFIGGGDSNPEEHSETRICKVGDFGLAIGLPVPRRLRRRVRQQGTRGYYAPEQFSRRWGYRNPNQSETAGNYGTHTNIWQVGVIMYQLVTLGPPPVPKEIGTSWLQGLTYGLRINVGRSLEYSEELQSLIWRCLSEKPRYRPSLRELDNEIRAAMAAGPASDKAGPPDEPEESAASATAEQSSSNRSTDDDSPSKGNPTDIFRFQVFRRDAALSRIPVPERTAWFEADGRNTIGDLKRALRSGWLTAAWPESGMGARKLWLLGVDRAIPDDDDHMELREWGVTEDSRIYIRVPDEDYFVRADELRFGDASRHSLEVS